MIKKVFICDHCGKEFDPSKLNSYGTITINQFRQDDSTELSAEEFQLCDSCQKKLSEVTLEFCRCAKNSNKC